jgi:hypothetical protein
MELEKEKSSEIESQNEEYIQINRVTRNSSGQYFLSRETTICAIELPGNSPNSSTPLSCC